MSDHPPDEGVMPFGRYAGLTYYDMVIEDMQYARFLLEQQWLDPTVAAAIRAAIDEYRADRAKEEC
jgi:hypothetical protein